MELRRFRTLAKNWELFGRQDPMFGVLSDPTKKHGRWQEDEFFESGRAHVAKLFRILAEHDAPFTPGRALDFGCGVGRLTRPIGERFEHTIGVDVAPSMIALARRHNPAGSRCEFVVNRHPDLHQFADASFDVVHTCLVLQHIPPEVSANYIREFLRITRPGGLVVFQVPSRVFTEAEVDARLALPSHGFRAHIEVLDAPLSMRAGTQAVVRLRVTNTSAVAWMVDIPGGRHICVANHWLDADGQVVVADDGRARLPHDLQAGESATITLGIAAPAAAGPHLLECDLVQERIAWFAQRGSTTTRVPVQVEPGVAAVAAPHAEPKASQRKPGLLARLRKRFEAPAPFFEMHVLPRADVESAVVAAGGSVLHAIDDGAAGAGWLSYTYVCRKGS